MFLIKITGFQAGNHCLNYLRTSLKLEKNKSQLLTKLWLLAIAPGIGLSMFFNDGIFGLDRSTSPTLDMIFVDYHRLTMSRSLVLQHGWKHFCSRTSFCFPCLFAFFACHFSLKPCHNWPKHTENHSRYNVPCDTVPYHTVSYHSHISQPPAGFEETGLWPPAPRCADFFRPAAPCCQEMWSQTFFPS